MAWRATYMPAAAGQAMTSAAGWREMPKDITMTNTKQVNFTSVEEMAHEDRNTTEEGSAIQTYLTGLRGVLAVESFLWVYFQTFIPAVASNSTAGPVYQSVIRDIFSVPFWNATFIQNFFILISMRSIATTFLNNPTGQTYAATVIRRIIRMVVLLCAASGLATLIFSQIGVDFIDDFKTKLPNRSIETPTKVYDGLAAVNSLFNLFWLSGDFYAQAANSLWPTGTLWAPSIMYYQSFTVYFLMVILPFTRPKWHLQGLALFALGSFWMESWGWYSATGLFFADLTVSTTLKQSFERGLTVREGWRLPYWTVAFASIATGIALKYIFTVLPQYKDSMLVLHPYLDLSENHSRKSFAEAGPYARLDDWFLVVGIFIAIECFDVLKNALTLKPLVWLGDRSFSIFAAQCIIFWTAGIKLWLTLTANGGMSTAGANAVVFVVGLIATAAFAELFYRAIDLPSRWLARNGYLWLVR